jgi:hypothetical protein
VSVVLVWFLLKYSDNGWGMKSLKNNALSSANKRQLCKTHNGKSPSSQRAKLSIHKSCSRIKIYHPLKRKKIKLHRLKFVQDVVIYDFSALVKTLKTDGCDILSKRYCTSNGPSSKNDIWSSEEDVINWLVSVNVEIKRITAFQFLLENKICSLNHVLVFANKKRVELGLNPFYMEGITEY